MPYLGFCAAPDMPLPAKDNYPVQSPSLIKKLWVGGGNVSFIINDQYYITGWGQTTGRTKLKIHTYVNQILFTVQSQVDAFLKYLDAKYKIRDGDFNLVIDESVSACTVVNGDICLVETKTGEKSILIVKELRMISLINFILS